jgi:NTE family protein
VAAAGYAAGWDDVEISERIRAAFVEFNPLGDLTFPMVAMTRGMTVQSRLKDHFGDIDIGDCGCCSCALLFNLTTATLFQHRRGKVRRALRASVALPGASCRRW